MRQRAAANGGLTHGRPYRKSRGDSVRRLLPPALERCLAAGIEPRSREYTAEMIAMCECIFHTPPHLLAPPSPGTEQ
jgi:hypothetical protein